jgi:hypothetical protein
MERPKRANVLLPGPKRPWRRGELPPCLYPARNNAYKRVYEALRGITWNSSACKAATFQVFGEDPGSRHVLPVWMFGEINRLRNDALHGNPMSPDRLNKVVGQ